MSQAILPLGKSRPDSDVEGRWKAIRRNWFDELNDAVREFRKLDSPEARAAFADSWIGIWARDFDSAWPMVYELLRLVEQQELYRDPRRVGPGAPGSHHGERTYSTFAEYFTDRVRQPFQRWAELEGTYQYAKNYAPELFEVAFPEATKALAERNQALDAEDRKKQRGSGRPKVETFDTQKKDIQDFKAPTGTSAEAALRRLRKHRPDIHARVLAGELTAHAGMIEAGFRKPGKSRRLSALTKILKLVPQLTNAERVELIEHLAP